MRTPPIKRFMRQNLPVDGGCWIWLPPLGRGGYGHFNNGTTIVRAHRWSYEHFVGPIPSGLDIDHLCRNRACVNPEHLEPVTRGENLRRGYAARGLPTHCPHGHEFTPENTYERPRGGRVCRTCSREALRRHRASRRTQPGQVQPDQAQQEGAPT